VFAKYLELTGRLYRAGVPILVGTDTPEPQVTPGFSLHDELELLVQAGIPPAAALTAATMNNAAVLRQAERLGSIAEGKLADMVLLEANPLDDIRNTRKIAMVVRSGVVSWPEKLLQFVPKE
jgi:imidazolonepropionase-like amidohydrolase